MKRIKGALILTKCNKIKLNIMPFCDTMPYEPSLLRPLFDTFNKGLD